MEGDERGSVTLWVLGLCLVVLALGGLTLDLWRAFAVRQALAAMADAAAVAGAGAVDEGRWRADGVAVLVPAEAEARAFESVTAQREAGLVERVAVDAAPDGVAVTLDAAVELTLLGLLLDVEPLAVSVTAVADPRASP